MGTHHDANRDDVPEPTAQSTSIVDREEEQAVLTEIISDPGQDHLHIAGPRGSGKSLLVDHAIATASDGPSYYIHCTSHDTQYKILKHLYEMRTGESISTGYHTSQLQHCRVLS